MEAFDPNSSGQALSKIGDPGTVDPLISIVSTSDDHWIKMEAALALGKIGDPRAVDALIGCLRNLLTGLLLAAAEALGEIGDPRAVEPLIEAIDYLEIRYDASTHSVVLALGKIRDPRAVDPLIEIMARGKNQPTRLNATWALGEIGDPRRRAACISSFKRRGLWCSKVFCGSTWKNW